MKDLFRCVNISTSKYDIVLTSSFIMDRWGDGHGGGYFLVMNVQVNLISFCHCLQEYKDIKVFRKNLNQRKE